ncbi:putative phage abortive infection protein [Flavobacterium collinsii]|uniref:Phage abortive infection protein n=1 Tax=Flavobacterium collinsii TaxID=1114861 RepID=A0ABM8KP79_9FLAO|nr:putative phage abortive infection protein [Flavobacterium collinsii]CAA9202114.1 hypothetical protein FLACOL7796_04093 [Flavobacterium collinsii]
MNNEKNEDEKNTPFILTSIIVSLLIIGLWTLSYYTLKDLSDVKRGTFGDMFGGVNALFSGLALAGIILTILLQRKELRFQREELRETRKEFEIQNETLRLQRFENTFFQLLNTHSSIVNSMDLRKYNEKTSVISEGRDCFQIFYTRLEHYIKTKDKDLYINPVTTNLKGTLESYDIFFEKNQNNLGHYFRNLYHIIKFVDNSEIHDKQVYINFVRAQLSSHELSLIFFNCLAPYGVQKFKPLIEKYSLLKNMNKGLIFNQEHLKEYNDSAYGK